MSLSRRQQDEFAGRIRAINKVSAIERQMENGVIDRKLVKGQKVKRGPSPAGSFLMLVFAAMVGSGSFIAARFISYHFLGKDDGYFIIDVTTLIGGWIGELTMAIVMAGFLGFIFRLGQGWRPTVLAVSMIGTFVMWDDLIRANPEPFVALFSPDYVTEQLSEAASTG